MNKSQRFWNRLSKNYDEKAKDDAFEKILSRTPKYLQPKDVVLDFGCATGLYSFELANCVKEIQAFDTSPDMISVAKDMALKNGNRNVMFSQTSLFDEQYKEGSFDAILAFNILLYFEDTGKVLNRMHKLLKPEGLIITATACLKEKKTLIGVFSGIVIYILKKLKILPYLKFLGIKELESTVTNAGFKILESNVLITKPAVEYFIVGQKE